MAAKITAIATHEESQFGELTGGIVRGIEFPIPDRITDKELSVVKRDFELMLKAIETRPAGFEDVLSAARSGDYAKARDAARSHGLTEEAFVQQGGGIWLAIAIGVAILLYSQDAL